MNTPDAHRPESPAPAPLLAQLAAPLHVAAEAVPAPSTLDDLLTLVVDLEAAARAEGYALGAAPLTLRAASDRSDEARRTLVHAVRTALRTAPLVTPEPTTTDTLLTLVLQLEAAARAEGYALGAAPLTLRAASDRSDEARRTLVHAVRTALRPAQLTTPADNGCAARSARTLAGVIPATSALPAPAAPQPAPAQTAHAPLAVLCDPVPTLEAAPRAQGGAAPHGASSDVAHPCDGARADLVGTLAHLNDPTAHGVRA
ncbi:hypothetical protein [Leucobacter sp. W1038]|uniref:hypothetical protein n=1 Tax=Leucobacter sp. W1038 TaxID=3438281 RepID=UPI003D96C060